MPAGYLVELVDMEAGASVTAYGSLTDMDRGAADTRSRGFIDTQLLQMRSGSLWHILHVRDLATTGARHTSVTGLGYFNRTFPNEIWELPI
jgi:hypothetical protein